MSDREWTTIDQMSSALVGALVELVRNPDSEDLKKELSLAIGEILSVVLVSTEYQKTIPEKQDELLTFYVTVRRRIRFEGDGMQEIFDTLTVQALTAEDARNKTERSFRNTMTNFEEIVSIIRA